MLKSGFEHTYIKTARINTYIQTDRAQISSKCYQIYNFLVILLSNNTATLSGEIEIII